MADDITIPTTGTGTATPVVATDDVAGRHFQHIKPDMGGAGAAVFVSTGAGSVGTGVQRTTLASDDPAVAVLGATTGAAVITDVNGTVQQYLRGLVKLLITTADYPEKQFLGTPQTVIDLATDIAAAAFSGAPAATFDNTTDALVPYATSAKVMAEFPDWAAAPAAGAQIELWGLLKDVDGTDDDTDAPSGSAPGGARYFGSFTMAAADALQRRTIVISLLGVEQADFYLYNRTAQNLNNDGGTNCVVKVTPFSIGIVV